MTKHSQSYTPGTAPNGAPKPARVLHVLQRMEAGGTQAMLMNLYRNIDRSKLQFDFLVVYDEPQFYDDEIRALGGRLFKTTLRQDFNIPRFMGAIRAILSAYPEYRVVHVHAFSFGYFALRAAEQAGVPVRIAHSHNNNDDVNALLPFKRVLRRLFPLHATHLYACSTEAGEYLFGKKDFAVFVNAIDVQKYEFNPGVRQEVRAELDLGTGIVVGHVGRFVNQKNHPFVLQVFRAIQDRVPDASFLLVGEGPLEDEIQRLALDLGIKNLRFLGTRQDVHRLFQAMDVFLLPSLYEGLGIVAVEAQSSGCPTLVADTVSRDVLIAPTTERLPLTAGPSTWADHAVNLALAGQQTDRTNGVSLVSHAGFNVHDVAPSVTDAYLKLSS